MKLIFLVFFTIIILTSCDTDSNRCLKSNGDIITIEEQIGLYNRITIQSDFEVRIENSTTSSISITAGENLIPYIEYSIIGNELTIKDNNGCDFLRERIKPIIHLKTPIIDEINIEQACDIFSVDTLKFDNLSIQNWAGIFTCNMNLYGDSLFFRCHASTGDYRLRGDCHYAYMYNVGNGYLRARALFCDYIHIVHSSIGDSEINANTEIILEKIEYGTVSSFSDQCPDIITWGNDWGKSFANVGCP
ncbi:MAG: DUF2807 domain-containing protein [Bacteroidales bacterium]|nr:DUF2807 domain-containing protein [Bacteroidales bacterium]